MEQRHGHVADVVGAHSQDDPHARAGHEDAPLRADDRLGRVRRARGEDQGPRARGVGFDAGVVVGAPGERVVERAAQHQQLAPAEINTVEQLEVVRLGDHEADVAVLDVALQVLAPTGVIETDDGGARQSGAAEGEQVLGHVVEQDADVERRTVGPPREEQVGPTPAFGHVLAVRPLAVFEPDGRPAGDVGISGVAPEERGGVGRRHGRLARGGDRLGRRHHLRQ